MSTDCRTRDGQEARLRIGTVIRQARKDRNWTQEQLAQAADVAENTIIRIERALKPVRAESLRKTLAVLDIDVEAAAEYPLTVRISRDVLAAWMLTLTGEAQSKVPALLTRWIVELNLPREISDSDKP